MASLRIVLGGSAARYSPAQQEELAARKNAYYAELIRGITPADLLPGAAELLAELEAHGVPRAIGSASKNAGPVLERLGIAHRFQAVVTGHDFTRGKPAPDVFLTAARKLGVAPAHCLVFEDAQAGIEAAHAGGMKAVGIGPAETVRGAERIVASLADLHYADLIALMQTPGAPP